MAGFPFRLGQCCFGELHHSHLMLTGGQSNAPTNLLYHDVKHGWLVFIKTCVIVCCKGRQYECILK